jgi:ATP-binding cassette subfamily A (ABC1) protein 3
MILYQSSFNRRGLWELIRKFKKDRSIILTTHFMEEADALSDRIAIMNHGQIKCAGSPLFLKNAFGSGYRLTLAKNANFDESAFRALLKSCMPDMLVDKAIETNIAAEMSVSVGFELSRLLPALLSELDQKKVKLGVDGYGISSPTIEEVFIK